MIFVMSLPNGWELYSVQGPAEFGHWIPLFVNKKKRRSLAPFDMAREEGARAIFHAVKRHLDVMDLTWKNPGEDPRFKAADKAKISLEMSLELHGKWSEDLKDTGIMAEA